MMEQLAKRVKDLEDKEQILNLQIAKLQDQVEFLTQKRNEAYYQKKLERLLDGSHQRTKHGITDISTKTHVYEIKEWKNYKAACGQLCLYNQDGRRKMAACFYGSVNDSYKQKVAEACVSTSIAAYEIMESVAGEVSLRLLLQPEQLRKHEEVENRSFNTWLGEHVQQCQNGLLQVQDICIGFLKSETVHSKEKKIYREQTEKFLKERFPSFKWEYGTVNIEGKSCAGWKHFCIR